MDSGQLNIEKITQLLHQHTFPASVEAALIAIRECSMFSSKDLSMLANRFIFCHSLSPSNTNPSQTVWIKTLNNIQELHTLDILRQFLENQTDLKISTRVFDTIFYDILTDPDNPLFTLYYNLILKFLSLSISFESKTVLTIIARWFLNISKTINSLVTKIIEYVITEHVALSITKSINNLCLISPLFTLCFIQQTCRLLEEESFIIDIKTTQTLIELLTHGLKNSTSQLVITLQQEFNTQNNSSLFNFVPTIIRLDVLFPFRSLDSRLDHFHTSILSLLFSILMDKSDQNHILQKNLLPLDYFEQLSITIQDIIARQSPERKSIEECVQRYLQIFSICKTSPFPLTQLSIFDLEKQFSLCTEYKLFQILKDKEEKQKLT